MAIEQITIKTTEVETQRIGYISFSITNIMNSSEPLMASGSVIEIGGSLYEITSNTDIDPAGDLAGISNGNMVWAYINASTLNSIVTTTEPIWSEEKQGWYDATETYRYYLTMFKDSSGNYINKQITGGRFWSPDIYITANYTVSDEFVNIKIIQDSSVSAAKTITLPTLADNIGKKITLENKSTTYQLIIDGEGSEDIEGTFTTINLSTEYSILEGTSSTWKRIEYSSNRPKYIIQHTESNNVSVGATASGSFSTRKMNSEYLNEIIGASLSANQFTLPIGKYYIFGICCFHATGQSKLRIQNITDASTEFYSLNTFCQTSVATVSNKCPIIGELTITTAKTFELQYRVAVTAGANGFGVVMNFGLTELYSNLEIIKLI